MIKVSGSTIIVINEKATLEDKLDLENTIDALIAEGFNRIYLDLGQTLHLPSELMGLLMWKKKVLNEDNIDIVISRISSTLKTVFETAHLIDFFEINNDTLVV
ncbi:MAG: hypothetical protein JXK07_12610 [Spirochaetes bacterium]|nr:hypothetical protein [Spirochaetota bacterium]MBN2770539.1 hypothetical protein [Spirochaetota bacterium]